MDIASSLTIGKLAGLSGVSAQAIRYYERSGLLPEATRTASGYRIYSDAALKSLSFIKHAQALGFSLSEIQELLSLRTQPHATCADIRQRACQKIAAVEKKIEDLQRIKNVLTALVATCPGNLPANECRLVEALQSGKSEQLM
jgi:Cu(I)-responsive transcriptional regulator